MTVNRYDDYLHSHTLATFAFLSLSLSISHRLFEFGGGGISNGDGATILKKLAVFYVTAASARVCMFYYVNMYSTCTHQQF